jgi:hypothetical protein
LHESSAARLRYCISCFFLSEIDNFRTTNKSKDFLLVLFGDGKGAH